MTAVDQRFAVRVMVTDVWDQVYLVVEPPTTVVQLKSQALTQALNPPRGRFEDSGVKFRGPEVPEEPTPIAPLRQRTRTWLPSFSGKAAALGTHSAKKRLARSSTSLGGKATVVE